MTPRAAATAGLCGGAWASWGGRGGDGGGSRAAVLRAGAALSEVPPPALPPVLPFTLGVPGVPEGVAEA